MITRCTNSRRRTYKDYGGRGIKVCERWRYSFENFYEDMGEPPTPNHSIDRIDVNGNYEPSNCRWATPDIQANNARSNHNLTLGGKTLSMSNWGRSLGIERGTLKQRLQRGWSVERTLTTPVQSVKGHSKSRWQALANHSVAGVVST